MKKIVILLLVVCIGGCKSDSGFQREEIKIVENKQVIKSQNLSSLLISDQSFDEKFNTFALIDTFFAEVYFTQILGLGRLGTEQFVTNYQLMLDDEATKETIEKINSVFADLKPIEKELNDAFLRYSMAFPEASIPQIIFAFTGMNYSVAAFENFLLVGLEFYLGSDFIGYRALGFPEYIIERRKPEYLVSEIIKGWLISEFPKNEEAYTLLDEMIYQGMILYTLSALCKDTPDHILMGYSPEQMKFVRENESNIWGYFINNKLLFSESRLDISKYTDEAPFSAGMPTETPGRTGVFIGWRIVEAFMKKHPEITLSQLMQNQDYKLIFTSSKYKPSK